MDAYRKFPYCVSRLWINGKWRYYDRTDNPERYVANFRKRFDPKGTEKLRIKDSRTKKVVYQD